MRVSSPHQLRLQGTVLILFAISRANLIPISLSMTSNLPLIQASLSPPVSELALATCKGQSSRNPTRGTLFFSFNASFPAKSTSPNMKGTVAQILVTMSLTMDPESATKLSTKPRLLNFEDRSVAPVWQPRRERQRRETSCRWARLLRHEVQMYAV